MVLATGLLASCGHEDEPVMLTGLAAQLPVAPDMNVLVISFDALRPDALGLYGYHRDTSPNLDRFATEALVFENAYTAAPATPTSFAAAFTGSYPYRVFLGWQLLPQTTLAQVMKEQGRFTFALMNNVQVAPERNFGLGFDVYHGASIGDRQLLKAVRKILRKHRKEPFFGWVHFISPHTPYNYRDLSSHLAPRQEKGRFAESVGAYYEVHSGGELERARELYDGEVFFADYLFGEVLEQLESLDLLDRTIIVVTADHGEEFMEHGRVGHKSLYEQVIQIPMMIRHPTHLQGSRTKAPYSNVDLLPTVASILGFEQPGYVDGIDLRQPFDQSRVRITIGMTDKERYEISAEQSGHKLIQVCTPEYREELYDLNADAGEQHDLILDDPAMAGELADALLDLIGIEPCQLIANSNRGRAPQDLLSPEQIEQLKSLGYIQ